MTAQADCGEPEAKEVDKTRVREGKDFHSEERNGQWNVIHPLNA